MLLTLTATTLIVYRLLTHPLSQPDRQEQGSSLVDTARELARELSNNDDLQWNLTIDGYAERENVTISWYPLDDVKLTGADLMGLHRGEPVVLTTDENQPVALILVPGTEKFINVAPQAPLEDPYPVDLLIAATGALATVGLFGLLLLLPVKKRLNRIHQAVHEFGQGHWEFQVDDPHPDAIGDLARALNNMARQIKALIRKNDILLGDQREMLEAVAHELRGPISRLNFALEMNLGAEWEQPKDSKWHDVGSALSDLNILASEVMGYARLEAGAPPLKMQRVEVDELINSVVAQYKLSETNIDIELNPPCAQPLRVNLDPHHLQRAVVNLVSNAMRFARRRVQIAWGLKEKSFWLTVDDDGPGIPTHKRDYIFEPFTRLDPSRSKISGGTGLGLAIVWRIARKHGGEVTAHESSSGGARFRLCWPSDAGPQDSASA
jgi:two-component system sensor histidine kinase RstB